MPDRADGAATGLYSRRSRTEAAFTGLRPAPHPVAALSLSVALGRDPAVAPTPHAPAVNRYVGRVTSLEKLYPDVWLTFNTLCKQIQGWIESRQGANDPSLSPIVRCPESRNPGRGGGFRICRTAKRARILQAESHDLQMRAWQASSVPFDILSLATSYPHRSAPSQLRQRIEYRACSPAWRRITLSLSGSFVSRTLESSQRTPMTENCPELPSGLQRTFLKVWAQNLSSLFDPASCLYFEVPPRPQDCQILASSGHASKPACFLVQTLERTSSLKVLPKMTK